MAETTTIEKVEELKNPFDDGNLLSRTEVEDLWIKKNEQPQPTTEVTEEVAIPQEEPIIETPQEVTQPEITDPFKDFNEEGLKIYNLIKGGKEDELRQYFNDKALYSQTDKLAAEEAIRLSLQKKNPHYTKEDIEDVMEDKYYVPSKPIKDLLQEDADYDAEISKWQNRVDKVNRAKERDAREARQELAKQLNEISLPDIQVTPQEYQLSQEELEKIDKIRGDYLKSLDKALNESIGIDAAYKDDEVNFAVKFEIPKEAKQELRKRLENFDLETYFQSRYYTDKGIDAQKLMHDIYFLENQADVANNIANKAGSQRFVEAEKARRNIKESGKPDAAPPNREAIMDALAKKMLTS